MKSKVQTLSANQQKHTLAAKIKKKFRKPSLQNPFTLTLPTILEKEHQEIEGLFEKCLSNNFCQSFIFGFNAVMRNLDHDKVISVLVDQSTKPELLINQFVKICSAKQIPIIKISCMGELVHNYLPKISKCSSIGIRSDIVPDSDPCILYKKTCSVLNLESCFEKKEVKDPTTNVKTIFKLKRKNISQKRLSQLHLKRTNIKRLIFNP